MKLKLNKESICTLDDASNVMGGVAPTFGKICNTEPDKTKDGVYCPSGITVCNPTNGCTTGEVSAFMVNCQDFTTKCP